MHFFQGGLYIHKVLLLTNEIIHKAWQEGSSYVFLKLDIVKAFYYIE